MPTKRFEGKTTTSVQNRLERQHPGWVITKVNRIDGSKMKGGIYKFAVTYHKRKRKR